MRKHGQLPWWQWIMPILQDRSPLLDRMGKHWKPTQPSSEDLVFQTGNFARKDKIFPHRTMLKMNLEDAILFPVLNCMATFLEYQHLKTHDDLLRLHIEENNMNFHRYNKKN